MEENLVGTQGGQALIERLEALNTILGGLRRAMVEGDGRVSSLEDQVALMSSVDLEQKVSQVNDMMSSLRGVIESKLETVGARLTELESQESPEPQVSLPEGFEAEWSNVVLGLEELKNALSRRVSAEEIFPQLDEIRAHQEAMESRLHALGQMDTVEELTELKDRQGDHQIRLQQLEASKEQFGYDVEQLKCQLPEMLLAQTRTQKNDLEGLGQSLHDIKQEIEQRGTQMEAQWASLNQESRDRLKGLEDWKNEALEFGAKIESDLRKAEGKTSELESKLYALESQSEAEGSELRGSMEESISELKMVLDGLSKRDVYSRAKESELQRGIDSLSERLLVSGQGIEAELNDLRAELQQKSEALGQLKLGQDNLVEELKFETEKRAEGMTRELVLARDHMEDQQKRVDEDLDDLKKSQRELGHVKEQLAAEEEASRASKKELRTLKEQLHLLSTDLRRQKSFAMGGVAAAFILSVTVSGMMMPTYEVMSNPMPISHSQAPAQFSEDLIPLEAPEVVELIEEGPTNSEVQVAEQIFDDPEPLIPQSEEAVVTTAFSRTERSQNSTPEVSSRPAPKEYVVEEGDNLWKIAKKHPGQGSLMERIEKIKKDNQLSTTNIRPGRVLSIYL